ncbi:MAG TPA: hypothetical protein VHI13_04805 [Candidatus Kapabacteria bacterium]|nr:hypothetical protein [Candidatus Kapabacteria bacterium]
MRLVENRQVRITGFESALHVGNAEPAAGAERQVLLKRGNLRAAVRARHRKRGREWNLMTDTMIDRHARYLDLKLLIPASSEDVPAKDSAAKRSARHYTIIIKIASAE